MKNTLQPLVSIVIITYNSSAYVLETLESAKAQTWKNVELIVTDDCSPDNTVEICKDWIEKNKERFIRTELITVPVNSGISLNCNRGIKASAGEWIKIIAGDDILKDNCIEDLLNFAVENPEAEFIISDLEEIDNQSRPLLHKTTQDTGLRHFLKGKTAQEQLKNYARWPEFLNSPTFFFKKETMAAIGYYDDEFKIYDDMCLIFKINAYNKKIFYLDKSTVKYRIHEHAISRSSSKKINDKRDKEAYEIFKKYRKPHLSLLNPIDLSVYYECWLYYRYKGFFGHKGIAVLKKFSLFYWYSRCFV